MAQVEAVERKQVRARVCALCCGCCGVAAHVCIGRRPHRSTSAPHALHSVSPPPPPHLPLPHHRPTHPGIPHTPHPQEITPEKALEILKRISDDDCRALGFDPRYSRPDWMILQVLPVPPPPVRPSVQMDSSSRWATGRGVWPGCSTRGQAGRWLLRVCTFCFGLQCLPAVPHSAMLAPPPPPAPHRSEDDLTHQLGEIVKANNRLRKQEESGAPQHIISEFALLLQMHVTGYIDNSLPGLPQAKQRSGRPIKSICQRLKGAWSGVVSRHARAHGLQAGRLCRVEPPGPPPPRPSFNIPATTSPRRQGGAGAGQPDGQACRLFGTYRHHRRPQPGAGRAGCALGHCAQPHLP